MTDVAAQVMAIVARKTNGSRVIKLEDRLEDLGLNSIDAVELIFDLEETFDITIPYNANSTRTDFDTVGKVVHAIEGLVKGKS